MRLCLCHVIICVMDTAQAQVLSPLPRPLVMTSALLGPTVEVSAHTHTIHCLLELTCSVVTNKAHSILQRLLVTVTTRALVAVLRVCTALFLGLSILVHRC